MQHANTGVFWDVFAAVALQRSAIIAPSMADVERQYNEVMLEDEAGKSLFSEFELRQKRDERLLRKRAEVRLHENLSKCLDEEIGVLASAVEEEWRNEAESIRKSLGLGDQCSVSALLEKASERDIQRKPSEPLILIVRRNFGRSDGYVSPWQLPMAEHKSEETLKETAEHCLRDMVPVESHASILSNAPFSVYSYRYPPRLKRRDSDPNVNASEGSMVFLFKALVKHINPLSLRSDIVDYKWVTAEELTEKTKSRRCSSHS